MCSSDLLLLVEGVCVLFTAPMQMMIGWLAFHAAEKAGVTNMAHQVMVAVAVTLAVVLNADQGLFNTDFRAAERLAQTIVQVAGRAGRGERGGLVLIQTEYPEHPLLTSLLDGGYDAFAKTALEERRAAGWPPFARLAALRASALQAAHAIAFLEAARAIAAESMRRGEAPVRLLGPAPAAMARRADRSRRGNDAGQGLISPSQASGAG